VAKTIAKKHSAEIQKEILGILSTFANISVSELAALLQIKPHVVRYNLQTLLDSRRINASAFINHRALGLLAFNMFFDLPASKQAKALQFLGQRPEVSWLTTVTGPRRFEATIAARDPDSHTRFLKDLGQATGTHLREPIFAIETEARHWGLRFLVKRFPTRRSTPMHFYSPARPYVLDEVDRRILIASASPASLTLRHLADTVKVPQTTLKYRLDKLIAAQVLSEPLFFVEANTFYMQAQLVMNLKTLSPESYVRVVKACEENRHVEGLISGVGNWDFKVILVAESFKQLLAVERLLLQTLARDISRSSLYLRGQVLAANPGV
jgi:DNA-binding Lrp family transcriptional regulator